MDTLENVQEEYEKEVTDTEDLKWSDAIPKYLADEEYNKKEKLTWKPSVDFNGVRRVRNAYSITKLNEHDWHSKNEVILNNVEVVLKESERNGCISKSMAKNMVAASQKMQQDNSVNIKARAKLIYQSKIELAAAISALTDESASLEQDKIRLQNSLISIAIPESITRECMAKRAYRPEAELILDEPESELIKELNLIAEIKIKFESALSEIQEQKLENKNIKELLEYDWSDKCEAYEIESKVCGLNNQSSFIMFKPGVTRTPIEQSSEQFWGSFTKENLSDYEKCLKKSVNLRAQIASMITSLTRDLRTQADNTERALNNRIKCTEEVIRRLEHELEVCLRKLVENEKCIEKMIITIKSFDTPMKVAQTRLDYRKNRPNYESCNDYVQKELINEVNAIEMKVSNLSAILKDSQEIREQIIENRQKLEREIMLKRKTLMIDGERCVRLRSRYPSASTMSGFIDF